MVGLSSNSIMLMLHILLTDNSTQYPRTTAIRTYLISNVPIVIFPILIVSSYWAELDISWNFQHFDSYLQQWCKSVVINNRCACIEHLSVSFVSNIVILCVGFTWYYPTTGYIIVKIPLNSCYSVLDLLCIYIQIHAPIWMHCYEYNCNSLLDWINFVNTSWLGCLSESRNSLDSIDSVLALCQ